MILILRINNGLGFFLKDLSVYFFISLLILNGKIIVLLCLGMGEI